MKWVLYVSICLLSGPLCASVQVHISDPNTFEPVNSTEVMVGNRISLVVRTDANDFWSGGVFIEGQDRARGRLQARDKGDPNSRDWAASHFSAAGPGAHVLGWRDSLMWGFDCYPDDFVVNRSEGNWFVIDYYALEEGLCDIGFYDHGYSWTVPDPNISLLMLNTRSRDIYPVDNPDGVVNLGDFAVFSRHWLKENCSDPNTACYKADFSGNGAVGLEDVLRFADYWLYGNPEWHLPQRYFADAEPENTEPNIVSDITYAIVDVNSMSEITLKAGESVELYIVKSSSLDQTPVFNIEVTMSDPNMGWIDNAYGTAQILAQPRFEMFDEIGPGSTQIEGIEFFAINMTSMYDGDMAGFVYTALYDGDVTLNLIDYSDPYSQLEPIVIHQQMSTVEYLQQIYENSPELQQEFPEDEWNEIIESITQTDPNQL